MDKMNSKQNLLFALRILFVVKLLLFVSPAMGQSKLSRVREAVRVSEKPAENSSERKRPRSNSNVNTDDDDHDHDRRKRKQKHSSHRHRSSSSGFGYTPGLNLFVRSAPQVIHTREIHVIEPAIIAEPYIDSIDPYAGQSGFASQPVLLPQDVRPPSVLQPEPVFDSQEIVVDEVFVSSFEDWGVRVSPWFGAGVDDISQANLSLLFQEPGSLGLDIQVRNVREKGYSDHLWLGDVNLVFEPIVTESLRMRLGLGLNWLADAYGSDAGFNLTAGFDARLAPRIILGGEVDFGNLGASDYLHTQLSIGYEIGNTELMLGYDHTAIGDIDLDSPFVGLRFRF